MARKNPLGKLVGTAVDAVKHPLGTAEKVVETARGTASLGKLAVEQVGKAAVERAGRSRGKASSAPVETPTSPADLRPVPSVNEPAHPPVEESARSVASTTAQKAPAKKADGGAPVAKKAPAKKAPAKKAPARKAPAAKKAAKKVAPPAPPAKEVPARRAAEPVTGTQEQALAESPDEAAKKAAARGAASKAAPGKKAPAAKKSTTKKAAAKKAPAKKAPAEQAPAPGTESETVWSTSTPGDRLPAGEGKRNEADPEVPVTAEDREAAHEATPADVAKAAEGD